MNCTNCSVLVFGTPSMWFSMPLGMPPDWCAIPPGDSQQLSCLKLLIVNQINVLFICVVVVVSVAIVVAIVTKLPIVNQINRGDLCPLHLHRLHSGRLQGHLQGLPEALHDTGWTTQHNTTWHRLNNITKLHDTTWHYMAIHDTTWHRLTNMTLSDTGRTTSINILSSEINPSIIQQ